MALQIRRGTDARRTSMPLALAQGELVYTTDTKRVFVGDGTTIGGTPVSPVISVNGQTNAVVLTTDSISEGTTNLFYTVNRVKDTVGSLLTTGTHTGLTVSYNNTTHALSITNTNVINTGTANSLAYWASNGTVLSPSASLTWNESSNILQNVNGTIIATSNLSSVANIIQETYNNVATGGNSFTFKRARGTNVTPTASVAGDTIHKLIWAGYDGTNFVPSITIQGSISTASPVSTGIVNGYLTFYLADGTGTLGARFGISGTGVSTFGPNLTTDTGSGSILVRQTVSGTNTLLSIRNYFSDAVGPTMSFKKYRGSYATSLAVQQNDVLAQLDSYGHDGSASQLSGQIKMLTDGTVSSGKVPGAIVFSTATSNGVLTQALKIDHTQNATFAGTVTSGTRISAVTPGNYTVDASSVSNQVTLSIGGTVAFANFSGSILVNCYNSGTVTQYLCGGGTTPVAVGSSKGSATGTMASTSGISGYTFTATEGGVHSFYVIRTRTGA